MPPSAHPERSDAELLDEARGGDTSAFALLWERHSRAGLVAARHMSSSSHADDLVSEAYLRILELVLDGRGPRGAFRPYLYRTIQSIAADHWRRPEDTSDALDEIPLLTETGPWEDGAFDRNAAARAFTTLTERWQAVLWYTEVEGMPPREVAKILGISPNGVSALAKRAREALQSAWVEAHVDRQLADEACRSTLEHLQRYQRGKLTAAVSREVAAHLDTCDTCARAAAEYSTLNRQLALVLVGVLLGGGSAFSFLGHGASAPASATTLAADRGTSGTGTGTGTAGAAGLGAVGGAGGLLIAAAVAGALVVAGGAIWLSQTGSDAPQPVASTASEVAPSHSPSVDATASGTTRTRPSTEPTRGADGTGPQQAERSATVVERANDAASAGMDHIAADAAASADGGGDGSGDRGSTTAGSSADGSADAGGSRTNAQADGSADGGGAASGSQATSNANASTAAGSDSSSRAASDGSADAKGSSSDDGDPALAPRDFAWARCSDERIYIQGTSEQVNALVFARTIIGGVIANHDEDMLVLQDKRWWSSTPLAFAFTPEGTPDSARVQVQLRQAGGSHSPWTDINLAEIQPLASVPEQCGAP